MSYKLSKNENGLNVRGLTELIEARAQQRDALGGQDAVDLQEQIDALSKRRDTLLQNEGNDVWLPVQGGPGADVPNGGTPDVPPDGGGEQGNAPNIETGAPGPDALG